MLESSPPHSGKLQNVRFSDQALGCPSGTGSEEKANLFPSTPAESATGIGQEAYRLPPGNRINAPRQRYIQI